MEPKPQEQEKEYNILVIPIGTSEEEHNRMLAEWLKEQAEKLEAIKKTSVKLSRT